MQFNPTKADQTLTGPARDLSLLLEASNTLASIHSIDELLQTLCQKMTESVESSYCRLYLTEEGGKRVTIRGFYAVRDLDSESGIGRTFPMDSLHWLSQVVEEQESVVITDDNLATPVPEPEYSSLFCRGARSVLLMPLVVKGHSLGVASLGEMRSWDRTPFTNEKIELCYAMARQGALAIENIRAIDSIANKNQQIKLILDNVAEGVFGTDANGRILVFNPAAEKMTGYAASAVIGHTCSELFVGKDADGCLLCATRCPIQQLLSSADQGASVEYKESITRADGTRATIIHTVAPILDPSHQIVGTVSVIRDVSREEELVWLKSEFISLVSHQLRTPLAIISTSAELLASSNIDKSVEKDLLRTLNEQCKRLNQLANQVLESSRLERGRIELILEPLALGPLIQQTVGVYRDRYHDYDIQVCVAPSLPFALGDRTSVEVILENLLQNAVTYSPPGGTITISAEETDSVIVISVADQGVGIPQDELDTIFRRFHRIANHANQQASGFGLGLYIAKMLVEAQRGKIWAESESGCGARFHFTLEKLREQ